MLSRSNLYSLKVFKVLFVVIIKFRCSMLDIRCRQCGISCRSYILEKGVVEWNSLLSCDCSTNCLNIIHGYQLNDMLHWKMDMVDIYTICVLGGSNIRFDCNIDEITIADDKWAAVNVRLAAVRFVNLPNQVWTWSRTGGSWFRFGERAKPKPLSRFRSS